MLKAENPIKYKVCSNVCPTDYLHYAGDLYTVDEATNNTIFLSFLDMRNTTYAKNNLTIVDFSEDKDLYEIYETAQAYSKYDNYLAPSINSKL